MKQYNQLPLQCPLSQGQTFIPPSLTRFQTALFCSVQKLVPFPLSSDDLQSTISPKITSCNPIQDSGVKVQSSTEQKLLWRGCISWCVTPTFTWWQCLVPHWLSIWTHDTGDGIFTCYCVAMVTAVGDLRSQFIVVPCPTGIHNITGIKTGFPWFFCWEGKCLYE